MRFADYGTTLLDQRLIDPGINPGAGGIVGPKIPWLNPGPISPQKPVFDVSPPLIFVPSDSSSPTDTAHAEVTLPRADVGPFVLPADNGGVATPVPAPRSVEVGAVPAGSGAGTALGGAVAGFFVGGPVGAAVGAAVGYFMGRK